MLAEVLIVLLFESCLYWIQTNDAKEQSLKNRSLCNFDMDAVFYTIIGNIRKDL